MPAPLDVGFNVSHNAAVDEQLLEDLHGMRSIVIQVGGQPSISGFSLTHPFTTSIIARNIHTPAMPSSTISSRTR